MWPKGRLSCTDDEHSLRRAPSFQIPLAASNTARSRHQSVAAATAVCFKKSLRLMSQVLATHLGVKNDVTEPDGSMSTV